MNSVERDNKNDTHSHTVYRPKEQEREVKGEKKIETETETYKIRAQEITDT